MKKMIKFLPLVVFPSLIVVACANAQADNKVSQDAIVNNENGITEFTVTVDFNGGTFGDESTKDYEHVRKGTLYQYFKAKLPTKEQITYEDHELLCYSLTSDGEAISDEYRIQDNITIYAVYKELSETHTVTFDTKGGSTISPITVFDGRTIKEAPVATKEGYEDTDDWFYKLTGEEEKQFIFGTTKVTQDMDLYCKWEKPLKVTVSFNAGPGSQYFDPVVVNYNETVPVAKKPEPKREKHTFDGWYWTKTYDAGTEFIFNDGAVSNPTHVTSDIELFAKWTEIEKVDLSFEIETSVRDFASWQSKTLPDNPKYKIELKNITAGTTVDPTKYTDAEGNLFTLTIDDSMMLAGWQDNDTHIIYPEIPAANNSANYTATIVGKKEAVHNVYFYDGSTTPIFTEAVIHGQKAIRPADPTSTGKVFKWWAIKDGAGTAFPFDTTPITADKHLVAVYEDATYTVTFDTKGGTTVPPQTVTHGETIETAPTVTRKGYHQAEETKGKWYYKDSTGKEAEFTFGAAGTGTPVTSDMTLYCGEWLPDELEVSFIAGEGSQYIESIPVEYGKTIGVSDKPIPTKEGSTFAYWYYVDEGGEHEFIFDDGKAETNPTHVTSDMVLKAHWDEITKVDITFEVDAEGAAWVYTPESGDPDTKKTITISEIDYGKKVNPEDGYTDGEGHKYEWTINDSKMLVGWKDSTGAMYESDKIPEAKANASYTAVLKDKPTSTVAVTFHSLRDDGKEDYVFLTENIQKGDCAIEPKKEPTEDWDMHDFTGWYTKPDGDIEAKEFDFSVPIDTDTDIYAHFKLSDTVNITFRNNEGKEELLPMAVGHPINHPISYWLINDSVRVGAGGWRNVADGKEITIVTQEHDGITCEPIPEIVPFDFEIDCKAADTQYQYTIDGETSISEEYIYNDRVVYHFDEDETGAPICPDHIVLEVVNYKGEKSEMSGSKFYNKTTGTIDIILGNNFMNYKSIKIIVYQNV